MSTLDGESFQGPAGIMGKVAALPRRVFNVLAIVLLIRHRATRMPPPCAATSVPSMFMLLRGLMWGAEP